MKSFVHFFAACLVCAASGIWAETASGEYADVSGFIGEAEYNALTADQQAMVQFRVTLQQSGAPMATVCFSDDTPPAMQQAIDSILTYGSKTRFNSISDGVRWTSTATDSGGIPLANPITVTWSIVPDGTDLGLAQVTGETDNDVSNLVATLNAAFGSQPVWEALMQSVLDQWSRVTGITYVKVSDDGAAFPSAPGVLGARGDVRFGGRSLDGGFGVLAYAFFPTTGDMVMDTDDMPFFTSSNNSFRAFRNTLSHEHGHSLGFSHVCPTDGSKIMEPFVPLSIDHSAPDDLAHGNRKYGDPAEKGGGNDAVGTATNLGPQGAGTTNYGLWPDPTLQSLSLDSPGDEDFFALALTSGQSVSFHLIPAGSAFPFGDDPGDLCGTATIGTLNSQTEIDLDFELIGTDMSTVLDTGAAVPAGFTEGIFGFTAPAAGTYYLRVHTNDAVSSTNPEDQVQLYTLRVVSPGLSAPAQAPAATWSLALLVGILLALGGTVTWSVMRRTTEGVR